MVVAVFLELAYGCDSVLSSSLALGLMECLYCESVSDISSFVAIFSDLRCGCGGVFLELAFGL